MAWVERAPAAPPRLDGARGLEVSAFRTSDLPELLALDLRLTGLERRDDLASGTRLVARRRGQMVGFLGIAGHMIGPALALDVADLGALIARALHELAEARVYARLSTAAPTAMLVALGLGFRVASIGNLMVRGLAPPARPPQLFGVVPEIL